MWMEDGRSNHANPWYSHIIHLHMNIQTPHNIPLPPSPTLIPSHSEVPQSTSLITFVQFLLVSLEGLFYGGFLIIDSNHENRIHPSLRGYIPKEVLGHTSVLQYLPFKVSLRPRVIPIYHWIVMVCLFWTVSIMNNAALSYRIDMPLHIVFKSGGLMINMLTGYWILKRRYVESYGGGGSSNGMTATRWIKSSPWPWSALAWW